MSVPSLRATLAVLALAAAAATAARATDPLPDPTRPGITGSARLEALVDRVTLEQKKMRTLEATFVQRRESQLLAEPEEARGTFSFAAPDKVRWEYLGPQPMTLVIDGEHMTTWYQDLGRAERLDVGRYSAQVLRYMGAGGSLETLLEYFTVTAAFPDRAEPYRLELTPRYERMAKRLAGMTIWIDRQSFLPIRLRFVDGEGDTTEYRFSDQKLNGELPADRFELRLPEGTELRVLAPADSERH